MRRREILTAVGALAVAGGATVADAQPGKRNIEDGPPGGISGALLVGRGFRARNRATPLER